MLCVGTKLRYNTKDMEADQKSPIKPVPASGVFEKIVADEIHGQQGAKNLTNLAKGALGEVQYQSQEPDAIAAAMKLAAQLRAAKENSTVEKED